MASPLSSLASESDRRSETEVLSETETDEQSRRTTRGVEFISKKNTKSPVWKYFGFTPDEEGRPANCCFPKCKICFKDVSAKFGNTSNLLKHLRLHHVSEFAEITRAQEAQSVESSRKVKFKEDKQPTLQHCLEQTKPYGFNSKEQRRMSAAVTNFIVRDVMPIYTVEKNGFRAMIGALNPRYRLPHKDYFSRIAIPELYEKTRKQLLVKIQEEAHFFSATTDLWSSCSSDPYLCLTIHYIDMEWNLQSHCLQVNYMPEDHTGENLQDALSTSFVEWGIDSTNLVAITTDSGSNIKLACDLLAWMRVSCFGHNLDLAINKGLKDSRIDRVVALCRKVVSAFSYSWKRQRDLKEAQTQKNLPEKKLKGDVVTRWGSKVEMMERMIEQQDAIRLVLSQDRKVSHLVPTWQDFDVLESVMKAVKGFSDLTDLLSGERRVTCSAIKPLIEVINKKIVSPKTGDSPLTLEVKERIRNDINTRYKSEAMSSLLDICSFLDPRFKDRFSIEDEPVVRLIDEMKTYDYQDIAATGERPSQNAPLKKKGRFSSIFGSHSSSMTSCNMGTVSMFDRVKRELDMYLQYPTLDIDESPLGWWKLECKRMPLLSIAARKYLCVCATSVTSERVFSVGGQVVNSRRSCLKPQTVNNLVFLAKNL